MLFRDSKIIGEVFHGNRRIVEIWNGEHCVYIYTYGEMPKLDDYNNQFNFSGKFINNSTSNWWYVSDNSDNVYWLDVDPTTKIFDFDSEVIFKEKSNEDWFRDNLELEKIYAFPVSSDSNQLSRIFKNCPELVYCKLNSANTSKDSINFQYADDLFADCSKLEQINFNGIGFKYLKGGSDHMFAGCKSLYYVKFNFLDKSNTSFSTSVYFGDSPLIREGAMNIINTLDVVEGQTITFNKWTYDQLFLMDLDIARNKGWNVDYVNVQDIVKPEWASVGSGNSGERATRVKAKRLSSFKVGALVLYDKANNKYIPVDVTVQEETFTSTNYPMVGLVAIDPALNVYGNGKIAIMALNSNSVLTPKIGYPGYSTYEAPLWGDDLGTSKITSVSTARNTFNQETVKNNVAGINAGYEWKTSVNIENEITIGNKPQFPALFCSWRYYTGGTKEGDWHLPSAGELYKFSDNIETIRTILYAVADQNLDCVNLDTVDRLYSCTEFRYDMCWVLDIRNNELKEYGKKDICISVPFISLAV